MTSSSNSLSERVKSSIQQLSLVATDLNKASDELGLAVSAIDLVLQSLNLGIPAWVRIRGDHDPESLDYWSRDLGYSKVGNKWGISLRIRDGNENWPDQESCDFWLFNDAPRWLRIEGVGVIPELLEALIQDTEETTKKIKRKTSEANEFAIAIVQASRQSKHGNGAE
jgi:hypothetical protein